MANRAALDEQLANELAELLVGTKRSAVALARRAAALKTDFFDDLTKRYDRAFKDFWRDFGMDRRFGTLSNFTKYANAGIAIGRMPSTSLADEARYPTSLLALYELSMLTPEELGLCLENTYTRTEVTDDRSQWQIPEPPIPLIAPATTARAIAKWRQNWRHPQPEPEVAPEFILVAKLYALRFDGSEDDEDWQNKLLRKFKEYISEFSGSGRLYLDMIYTPIKYMKSDPEMRLSDDEKDEKWSARIEKAFSAELVRPSKKFRLKKPFWIILCGLGFRNVLLSSHRVRNGKIVEKEGFINNLKPGDYRTALAEEYIRLNGSKAFLSHLYRHNRLDPTLISDEEEKTFLYLQPLYREQLRILTALNKPKNADVRHLADIEKMEAEFDSLRFALPESISNLSESELDEIAASYVPNIVQYGWGAWRPKN